MAKVLIVDDSAENIEVLSSVLAQDGHVVESLRDPGQVFNTVFRVRPDLVLCDVMMPGIDGGMVTRLLRRLDETRAIPVLLCSALDESELAARTAACGADGYVRKAALPREICGAVRRALRDHPRGAPAA